VSGPTPKSWTGTQAYTMASICLFLGTAVGYLLNSPSASKPLAPQATVHSQPTPAATRGGMPTPDDMKRMAEKQVAPLLDALKNNPNDAELLEKIGRSYMAAQQYSSARPYFEHSVAVKPTPDSLNELSFVYYSTGDADKAIATINRALKVDPKNPKLLFNLGMFEWHGKSDPKAAIAAWEKFVKSNPNDPNRAQAEHLIAQAKQHLTIAPGTRTDRPTVE
jgi:cytochrome c-type biogenesis protein CcmH/NrfG